MDLTGWLRANQVSQGGLVGIAVAPDQSVAVAVPDGAVAASPADVLVADGEIRPRWAVWSQETARALVGGGVRLTSCWDVAAVHRLLFGGWRADPAYAWALSARGAGRPDSVARYRRARPVQLRRRAAGAGPRPGRGARGRRAPAGRARLGRRPGDRGRHRARRVDRRAAGGGAGGGRAADGPGGDRGPAGRDHRTPAARPRPTRPRPGRPGTSGCSGTRRPG